MARPQEEAASRHRVQQHILGILKLRRELNADTTVRADYQQAYKEKIERFREAVRELDA